MRLDQPWLADKGISTRKFGKPARHQLFFERERCHDCLSRDREFHSSRCDSSDKFDQPSNPAFFTERFTSMIACGMGTCVSTPRVYQNVRLRWRNWCDYWQQGFYVSEEDIKYYIWGYTIISDSTLQEQQGIRSSYVWANRPTHKLERWHGFEDTPGIAKELRSFMSQGQTGKRNGRGIIGFGHIKFKHKPK